MATELEDALYGAKADKGKRVNELKTLVRYERIRGRCTGA